MIRAAVVAMALLEPAVAAAQESAPGTQSQSPRPGSPESMHVHNYGAFNAACLRWSDGCRVCNRGADGEGVCSNIGIACQPAEVKCIEAGDQQKK